MIDEDLVKLGVEHALGMGASYAEARYQRNEERTVALRNGRVIGGGVSIREGIGIRVLINGSLGFAATNDLRRESIREAAELAVSRAKSVASLRRSPIEFSEARMGRASYRVKVKEPLENVTVESIISLGKEVTSSINSSVSKVKVPAITIEAGTSLEEKLVINSEGAYVHSVIPRVTAFVNFVLVDPQKGSIQRMIEKAGTGGSELIRYWRLESVASDEARRLERVLTEGVEPPKDLIDVVVGSEVVGLIVHESAGHPMEADRILGREAAQAGESFVKPEMIGNYVIGSEYATVIEDPTIPGSNGYYLFDDEGVPARPRYLYKEGVIHEPLHNRHTAKLFGTESNAAARSMDYASEPIIRMSNTYLKPGDRSFNELLSEVKYGVYIKSFMEWNIDDRRWNQRYVGLESYIIRNGELGEPVRNAVLEITTKGFYSRIAAVDKNLEFYPGTCGKGEPAQGVPVWFGGPNVLLKQVRLGVIVS